jgi:enamine deaminase RidA (YjgF/YER057c/UK114 family)
VLEPINPESLGAPKGYSNGILAPAGARLLFVAGQVGWDKEGKLAADFVKQFDTALANVLEVVKAAGGGPTSIARLTIYVTDKREYADKTKEVGAAYRARMGKWFPAMALVEVKALLEKDARVEIEATAAIEGH